MPLETTVALRTAAKLSKALGAFTGVLAPDVNRTLLMADGIGLDQADQAYYARPTIAGSATLTLARVKLVRIKSDLTLTPNVIHLVRPASNGVPLFLAAGDGIEIRPGGDFAWVAPDATGVVVTAGTGDLLNVVNTAAGNVQPEILIVGASA